MQELSWSYVQVTWDELNRKQHLTQHSSIQFGGRQIPHHIHLL